jgi:hypothetical protein
MSKNSDIAKVAAQLDGLLDTLTVTVEALQEILARPVPEGGGANGRLATP